MEDSVSLLVLTKSTAVICFARKSCKELSHCKVAHIFFAKHCIVSTYETFEILTSHLLMTSLVRTAESWYFREIMLQVELEFQEASFIYENFEWIKTVNPNKTILDHSGIH